jgi:glycosyltransferase involved in cell wall biosynthesis
MRILFVISDLTYGGAAKQLVLLAAGLQADRFQRRLCVLGTAGPWVETLRAAGVIVDVLDWRWKLDLTAFGRLRHLFRAYQADPVHVWGRSALQLVALAGGLRRSRAIVTMLLPPRQRTPRIAWRDRWLLRRAAHIIATSKTDGAEWRRLGLEDRQIVVVPPGVEAASGASGERGEPLRPRTILCVGPLLRHKGFRDAIWVIDILRYLYADAQLAIVGDGPDRTAIERFAHHARVADRVHFLGERRDLPNLLAQAELVWAPSRSNGGVNAVLESMAAGKAVVGTLVPGLAEVVIHGQTGFLVPPADQAALARHTRLLLDDSELRQRMGKAGRQRVTEHFAAAAMIDRLAALYEGVSQPM